MNKDPLNYSIFTYLWVLILSIWGGTAYNIRKIREGKLKRFSFSEWVGDIVISGFLGVITFWLCEYADIDPLLTAAIVGISSHQGTKGIAVIEDILHEKLPIKKDK